MHLSQSKPVWVANEMKSSEMFAERKALDEGRIKKNKSTNRRPRGGRGVGVKLPW